MTHHYNHNLLNAPTFLTLEMGHLTLQIIAIFGSNFGANQHPPSLSPEVGHNIQ